MSATRRREGLLGWLFVAPATLHLLVFALFPIGYAIYLSLFKWQLFKGTQQFAGLSNFAIAFREEAFWNALWNSARYALVGVPLGMVVALAVALLVNQRLPGMSVFRTLFYTPAISSGVAVAMVWIYVYLPETGLINSAIGLVNAVFGTRFPTSTDFLARSDLAMWMLVFMSVWTGLGPRMVLFLAGLVGIPQSIYEAAELDGAGRWRVLRSVTLPLLAPTTLFVLVTSSIGALQVFTPVYMMTRGGPEDTTDVIGYHIYNEAWVNFNMGLAAAKSLALFVIIAAVAAFQFRLMRSRLEGYSAT